MGYDDRREIYERLEALERRLHDDRGSHDSRRHHAAHRHGHHCGAAHERDRQRDEEFDEKRVIDTIVDLVEARVADLFAAHQAPATDGGGEKRLVDLIVSLVSEHVREIVAEELDRRLERLAGGPVREPSGD